MTHDPFEPPDDARPEPADDEEVAQFLQDEVDESAARVRRSLACHFYRSELSVLLRFGSNLPGYAEIRIAQIVPASRHTSGYRRQRRRMGYRLFPSRRKVRERWTFTGGQIIIPPRCDECGAPFGVCAHPPF